jgi:hypothetical protein
MSLVFLRGLESTAPLIFYHSSQEEDVGRVGLLATSELVIEVHILCRFRIYLFAGGHRCH